MYRVNHNNFRYFDYENEFSPIYQLGDVILKDYKGLQKPEIGVVIQTFSDGDVRTDMWGMCSPSEVRTATLDEIKKYRIELMKDLLIQNSEQV